MIAGHSTPSATFPSTFLWGAATSSHQVEGNNCWNDWWSYEQSARLPFKSLDCCDHYHRYEEDLDLARSFGHSCHRFSIEWSRVEPEQGAWDEQAVQHYADVIAGIQARGMEPVLTLQHFTLPVWFAARGGWERADSAQLFARFVARLLDELHQPVKFWLTINEPTVYVLQAYINGAWPPQQRRSWMKAARVLLNLARAHVLAYEAIKRAQPDSLVSFSHSALLIQPCDPKRRADRVAARLRDLLLNRLFFRMIGSPDIGGRDAKLDFIGINYYTRSCVRSAGGPLTRLLGRACKHRHHEQQGVESDIGWEVYPSGLKSVLARFAASGLPLFITENGIATTDDELRCQFLTDHVSALGEAMAEGINVLGYLHWSLIDNFEWDQGTAARFGLVGVDYETQQRTPRRSARVLAQLARGKGAQAA